MGMERPLPIQEAAFGPISKGRSVVIGSATGSGKTLAFLLPLLASTPRSSAATILVVTASRELTLQLRREVDRLWPPLRSEGAAVDSTPLSALHIVAAPAEGDGDDADAEARASLCGLGNSPIVVGTPAQLLIMVREAAAALRDRRAGFAQAAAMRANLRAVVVDEADQLLESSLAAAVEARRRAMKASQGGVLTARQRAELKRLVERSVTEELLAELPTSLSELQLVCASATVGRSLRRKLQSLTGAASIDKAAELITLKERDAKGEEARRQALMPPSLAHAYVLIPPADNGLLERHSAGGNVGEDLGVQPAGPDEETLEGSDSAQLAKAARAREEDDLKLAMLCKVMEQAEPAPAIVFAGRLGVSRVRNALIGRGLARVSTVQELAQAHGTILDGSHTSHSSGSEKAVPDEGSSAPPTWEHTPIYVASERFGRGLDLDVDYVFLLSAPASCASYAHLAGRTGRKGRSGTAVTLLSYLQAPRVVAYAQAFGISFTAFGEGST